jgi:16S rRNA C1402 (ribose-2'-O) methylase RsmI
MLYVVATPIETHDITLRALEILKIMTLSRPRTHGTRHFVER